MPRKQVRKHEQRDAAIYREPERDMPTTADAHHRRGEHQRSADPQHDGNGLQPGHEVAQHLEAGFHAAASARLLSAGRSTCQSARLKPNLAMERNSTPTSSRHSSSRKNTLKFATLKLYTTA